MHGYTLGIGYTTKQYSVDVAVVRSEASSTWWEQEEDVTSLREIGRFDYETTRVFLSFVYRFGK
jgi:hypothetical protein